MRLRSFLAMLALPLFVIACGQTDAPTNAPAAAAAPAPIPDPFVILQTQRVEHLFADEATMPLAVRALIQRPDLPIDIAIRDAEETRDDLVRFNIVLILSEQLVAGQLSMLDDAKIRSFLESCLERPHPWMRTQAAQVLGELKDRHAIESLQACLRDPAPTVVLHAAMALQAILGVRPELSHSQQAVADQATQALLQGMPALNALADRERAAFLATSAP